MCRVQTGTSVQLPVVIADLLILPAIVYDLGTRGRIHPVYLIGGVALILLHILSRLAIAFPLVASVGAFLLSLQGESMR